MRRIEVFAEMACPFTHVGLHRLVDAVEGSGRDVEIVVRAWPLELVNGAPLDPVLVGHEIDALREQVAPELFTGFRADAFPASSVAAFGLAAAAYGRDAATGLAVSLALRDALFERGRDIAADAVVTEIAGAFGLARPDEADARARTEADWHEGRARGVVGSPHFFVDGRGWFCPVLDISHRDDGSLHIRPDEAAMREFLDAVLD